MMAIKAGYTHLDGAECKLPRAACIRREHEREGEREREREREKMCLCEYVCMTNVLIPLTLS